MRAIDSSAMAQQSLACQHQISHGVQSSVCRQQTWSRPGRQRPPTEHHCHGEKGCNTDITRDGPNHNGGTAGAAEREPSTSSERGELGGAAAYVCPRQCAADRWGREVRLLPI